jgi:hypothetical protein
VPGGAIMGGSIGRIAGGTIGHTTGGQIGATSSGFEQIARIAPSTQRQAQSAAAGPAADSSHAPMNRSGGTGLGARGGKGVGTGGRIALLPFRVLVCARVSARVSARFRGAAGRREKGLDWNKERT